MGCCGFKLNECPLCYNEMDWDEKTDRHRCKDCGYLKPKLDIENFTEVRKVGEGPVYRKTGKIRL